jgi:putative ABC transport system permease protein
VIDGQAPVDAARNPLTNLEGISPGYFQTLGIPIIAGRDISDDDRDGRPAVALVGESFARRFWPKGDAIGRRLRFPLPGSRYDRQWFTVVGIVGDAKYRGLREHRLDLYISAAQCPYSVHQFVVRADRNPTALTGAIRAEVRAIDRDLPIDDVVVLSDAVARQLANPRFTAVVFVAFATTAAALAALGLGTLISWLVRHRTPEIGLRVALGATPADVTRLVMVDGARIIGPGVAAGIAVAALMTTFLRSLLFEVSPRDPAAIGGAAALAILVGLLSSYLPARRAGRVDPMIAMRQD